MFISPRIALVRNLAVAGFNGLIALVILLIAPMGLAGVITNTLMITVASFFNATACDRIVLFLQSGQTPRQQTSVSPLERDQNSSDIEQE
ncbi:MAG: CRISPR-associated protein Csx18 [Halothece sp. Uz-M2-17]|nr:CRISPR-associated protein Csx18 [Halothece sp. Uz-M2-17]